MQKKLGGKKQAKSPIKGGKSQTQAKEDPKRTPRSTDKEDKKILNPEGKTKSPVVKEEKKSPNAEKDKSKSPVPKEPQKKPKSKSPAPKKVHQSNSPIPNHPMQTPKDLKLDETNIFLRALQISSTKSYYSKTQTSIQAKESKIQGLNILCGYIEDPNKAKAISLPHLKEVFKMIENNIFRPLSAKHELIGEITMNDLGMNLNSYLESEDWVYIHLVYRILKNLSTNNIYTCKDLRPFLDRSFFSELFYLLDSENSMERALIIEIIGGFYTKIVPKRLMIKSMIDEYLVNIGYFDEDFNGVNELLAIKGMFVKSYSSSLKDEFINEFTKIILPLYKGGPAENYIPQLNLCVSVYLSKDFTLSLKLLDCLLRYWPFGNSNKELLFIEELQEAIRLVEPSRLGHLFDKLLLRIFKCLSGPHLQVAQKTYTLLDNEFFHQILSSNSSHACTLIVPLPSPSHSSFNSETFSSYIQDFKTLLQNLNPTSFNQALNSKKSSITSSHLQANRVIAESKWDALTAKAQFLDPNFLEIPTKYSSPYIS